MLTDRPNPLPEELERALRRATDRTLAALTALRRAVRDHVHKERSDGNDLDQIQLELQSIVARALDGVPPHNTAGGDHATLTRQIIRWSEGFYAEKKT
jgi:hypothetical protein